MVEEFKDEDKDEDNNHNEGNDNANGESKATNSNSNSRKEKNESESCAQKLIQLADNNISELFKNQFGAAFGSININSHCEIIPLESSKFKRFLSRLYYNECKDVAYTDALNNSIQILCSRAQFDGPSYDLHLRVAQSNNKNKIFYYDLTNDKYEIVEISKDAWHIIPNNKEIIFTRYNQRPQLYPDTDYDNNIFDQFMKITNVKDYKSNLLLRVYIVSLLIPDIPHPILYLHGEKGAAKTTIMKLIKMLVDPSKPELLTINKNQPEFVQQLSHYHVAYYDNVKSVPFWLSDEACKAVTGVGNTKRKLYSDDDDIVYEYKRCLGINGINIALTEPDALDRTILIEVERIRKEDRQLESVIDAKFQELRPKLLAYIFDILVKTLQIKDSIKLEDLPRMADFALWGETISRAMGYKPLEFINAYYENIGRQNIEAIESNPLGQAVVKLSEELEENKKSEWYSSATECLEKLNEIADKNKINTNSKSWPKGSNSLTRALNKIRSNLLEGFGIEVLIDRVSTRTDKYKPNTSTIKVRKIPPTPPTPPTDANSCSNLDKNVGDINSVGDTIPPTSKIPPTPKEENRAQIASDIDNVGDVGDVGDTFRNNIVSQNSDESLSDASDRKIEDDSKTIDMDLDLDLDLEKIKFEPISNILKEQSEPDNPISNSGLKAVEGVSFVCPDCNQLVFSDKSSRELHRTSCSSKKR